MASAPSDSPQKDSKYSYRFRLSHWVLLISSALLIVTGLSLHAASRPAWSIFGGHVPNWLWRGRMDVWHYWAAVAFLPVVLVCVPMLLQKAFWRRPTRVILIVGGLALALTGLWMQFPFGPVPAVKTGVAIHAALGLLLFPLALLCHMATGLTRFIRSLVPSFRLWSGFQPVGIVILIVAAILTTWVMFEGWPLHVSWRNLVASRIETPSVDAEDELELAGLPWDQAAPLQIRLVGGSGFNSGQTDMTLQALHDGEDLFIKAQWDDASENYGYWPWKKRDDGWEYLQTSKKDEITQYEDKFSMVFPIEPSWQFEQVGCAVYCHVDGNYGWGYKGGQPDLDAWHWKAARTGSAGQVDDKYWSIVDFEAKDIGRLADPKDSGGFVKNISEDHTQPLYLPDEWSNVYHGAIPDQHKVDFTAEAANELAVGTEVPGIVTSPFVGDRGDVLCQSVYAHQKWTLYIRRKLNTGSERDAQFSPGNTYAFGCAAFDHAGKRHARSMPVLRLVVQE